MYQIALNGKNSTNRKFLEIFKTSSFYCKILVVCVVATFFTISTQLQTWSFSPIRRKTDVRKYVGLYLNRGRIGNQLYQLMTGYGIARRLRRVHYLSIHDNSIALVANYLRDLKKTFPRIDRTFVISPYDVEETVVPLAKTCCDYVDPLRYSNNSAQYLLLSMKYGQHPGYFKDYVRDVRRILQFSDEMQKNGSMLLQERNITGHNFMCIHTRTTDFTQFHRATNMTYAVSAATDIASQKNMTQFMIFGDDQEFMYNMSELLTRTLIERKVPGEYNSVYVSNFSTTVDLYVSSVLCNAFLMSSSSSTFGWWLAFLSRNQNAVFYLKDELHKRPAKEHFLNIWREY